MTQYYSYSAKLSLFICFYFLLLHDYTTCVSQDSESGQLLQCVKKTKRHSWSEAARGTQCCGEMRRRAHRPREWQTDRLTYIQTDRHTHIQKDRQTDRPSCTMTIDMHHYFAYNVCVRACVSRQGRGASPCGQIFPCQQTPARGSLPARAGSQTVYVRR